MGTQHPTRLAEMRPRLSWRTGIAAIVTTTVALVSLGLMLPASANATEDHSTPPPTQDVSCDTITADYHRPLTNGDHINVTINPPGGQVNVYVDQNIDGGASYNGQNGLGLKQTIFGVQTKTPLKLDQVLSGVITFNYGQAVKAAGINTWKVPFVQTNSTDTWPGLECGDTPPPPPTKDATASIEVTQQATCTSPTQVKYVGENVTWNPAEPDLTVGTHPAVATAIEGAKFPDDGSSSKSLTYTIDDKKPSQSTDSSGDCYVPPTPTCVEDSSFAYTFDPATGSGVVTVTGGEDGEELCEPLFVRATTYKYVSPASGSPSWPQNLVSYNDTTVDKIGTFSYSPPQVDACRQYDAYASFKGYEDLKVSEHLEGPNNPFEPAFLHDVLAGKGPNPTYSYTTSDGCNTPEPPTVPEPKVTHTDWQDGTFTCGDTSVTQTRTVTTTPFKAVLVDNKWVIVEDTEHISTVTEQQTRPLTQSEIESCEPVTPEPPTVPEPKVTHTDWQDGSWKCGDTEVTQTRTTTTTPFKAVLVDNKWVIVEDTAGITTVTEKKTRHLTESEIENCATTPNPPTDNTPPSEVTPPVVNKPVPPVVAAAVPQTPSGLALTGADGSQMELFGLGGLALLLLGGVAIGTTRMVRRKSHS